MDTKESEFLKRLEAVFKIEAEEHLRLISEQLIELEKESVGANSASLSESIFREIHSLKGAARSVNRTDIESVCRFLEKN